jgi:thiaminase/transcriptional activator TenA
MATDTTTVSGALIARALPEVESWTEVPLLKAMADGTLDPDVFRHYLEQDYLYVRSYVRFYAKLASVAPSDEVEPLVEIAWRLADVELGLHRELGAAFDCDFSVAPTQICADYMAFLMDAADDFGLGLVAALPCIWGYGVVARRLPPSPNPMFQPWIDVYDGTRYAGAVESHCERLDAVSPDPEKADALFRTALDFEYAFWHQLPE